MNISTMINDSPTREFDVGSLSGGAYTAVELTAGGLSIAGASSVPIGLLIEDVVNDTASVQIEGGGYWLTGESIQAGDLLSSDANGKAVKSTSGKFIFAQAIGNAAASSAVEVQIVRAGFKA